MAPTRRPTASGLIATSVAAAVAAAALCLVVSAIASSSTATTVPARDAAPVGGASTAPSGGLATRVTPLGTVVTAAGFTVYRFDKDSAHPSRSACTGTCAKTWPPLLGDGIPALAGVPRGRVGTAGRPDGTQQLTLDGWPLYRFAKDARPGDTKGEGVGGTWRAVGIDGKPALVAAKTPVPKTAAPDAPAPKAPAPSADTPAPDYAGAASGY
jgi:predicted lipoprotein with Yx(FWY)xxD motif